MLDDNDDNRIRNVALYLPRQQTWLRWSLKDLMDKLSGDQAPLLTGSTDEFGTALGDLRAEFRWLFPPTSASSPTDGTRRKR